MKSDLPLKYAFILGLCNNNKCIHPLCGKVSPKIWYPDGPVVVENLPLPTKDDNRQCNDDCVRNCPGHYMAELSKKVSSVVPSIYLAEKFKENINAGPAELIQMSRKCMLKANDVKFFWEHMQTVQRNRQKGARKAQETRARKKATKSK